MDNIKIGDRNKETLNRLNKILNAQIQCKWLHGDWCHHGEGLPEQCQIYYYHQKDCPDYIPLNDQPEKEVLIKTKEWFKLQSELNMSLNSNAQTPANKSRITESSTPKTEPLATKDLQETSNKERLEEIKLQLDFFLTNGIIEYWEIR
jgi:hypothetical protein